MSPTRRQKLTRAADLIRAASNADSFDAEAVKNALRAMGAKIVDQHTNTYSVRLAGVTASSTYDKGEHLLVRWAANARVALAEDPANG
jgi:hypothetical protein